LRCGLCIAADAAPGRFLMARYVFVLRHSSFAVLQDGAAGMELPDDAAAREFAAKVMSGLVWQKEDNWAGWTMEVWQGGRRVWHLPFDPIEPPNHH
jgi:hypothetical protein